MQMFNPVEPLSMEAMGHRVLEASSDFAKFQEAELYFWFIKSGEGLVGNISMRNINRRMLTAEIGYGIALQARGNGYATAAVRLITEAAFRQTPLRKLIACVHEDNRASRRVLEKVGYTQEGLLREHYLINGEPANEVLYGILRRDVIV